MRGWTAWEVTRHQVAVAGRVVDESDKPVAGAQVTLTLLPKEGRQKKARAGTDQQESDVRCGQTFTKADGIFFFLDFPEGEYSVECGRSGFHDKKTVVVTRKKDGALETAIRELDVPELVSFLKRVAIKKELVVADLKLRKAEGRRQ